LSTYDQCPFQGTQIRALLIYIFHHAECDGDVCENCFMALFITSENDGSCVELHGFRGLYVSRMGEVIKIGFFSTI
jgi:hypothetical protein